ncbi:MliC family protein [Pectobacterium wasabiae]|uniref:Membrane-bound lysozyme inhibitor of C-type lysozyme n=1 Tax=Pectobacterium wasabiae TaxID=55208 RepID=A0AAW3EFL2_9GAMM|nr:MliC family protein [Pectobacterium wasabiae]AOR65633.1 lysozyme inhibitor [Pectobacterium wasabiae CFBP 3304]EJS94126.1 Lysozyme inhibitor [Pectobacterium wasabiae CFBP 3304]KFX05628.1 membrane-bound lysozyme inhibitor of C-type lysozyme [Pectobacterium wasabiae]KGA30482.1 membrane-bound lysozyme inhibitor of C-type lysozyme [Pectobacterium wasabiae]
MKQLLTGAVLILLSGCSYFGHKQTVETLHYQCGTMPLTVTLQQGGEKPAQVSFLLDGERLVLPQVVSASGVRYSNATYTFWSKGERAFIQRGERVIVDDCMLSPM